ncbi:hypothetical protein [Dyella silvatica]|uniref:hypothetical protein n=1 Tax=Dyella silvatica TaxID=2992128 RepID=UPI0022535F0B|nr:hypothetical protein [Dyella silvatica]
MADPQTPEDPQNPDKVVMGIHTNTLPGASLTDGHAWLTLTRNGHTEAYGLWPNSHPRFANESPHPESNIRTGIENNFSATASRYYELSPEQVKQFDAAVKEKVTWGLTNTCASWASSTAERVTGEHIDASELLGVTGTPRQIHKSIDELEKKQPTTTDKPLQHVDEQHHSSSFSQTSAKPAVVTGDAQADALLAAAGDPKALGKAMQNLAASPDGQAFRAQGQEQFQAQQAQQAQPTVAPAQTQAQPAAPPQQELPQAPQQQQAPQVR